jgi:hypothetical protein
MQEKLKTELKILRTLLKGDPILVSGKLVSGDVYGKNKYFSCVETGGKWKLVGVGLVNLETDEKGVRLFEIKYVEGSKSLEEGFTLVSL